MLHYKTIRSARNAYQMAWRLSFGLEITERFLIKSLNCANSLVSPAWKPRESWMIIPGWCSDSKASLMLWSPCLICDSIVCLGIKNGYNNSTKSVVHTIGTPKTLLIRVDLPTPVRPHTSIRHALTLVCGAASVCNVTHGSLMFGCCSLRNRLMSFSKRLIASSIPKRA